jgi:hypothetical protein
MLFSINSNKESPMFKITEVIPAPMNTITSSTALAAELTLQRGVYCFDDYNDVTNAESVYVTDAPSKEAYEVQLWSPIDYKQ